MRQGIGKRNRASKGLTLLEVIVVFVILSTTAVLVVPNLQKGIEQKKADSAIASLRKISHCIRLYKQEHGGSIPGGTKYEVLETGVNGNGCYDRTKLAPGFDFPLSTEVISSPITADAKASGISRNVCIKFVTDQTSSGVIFDYPLTGACPVAETSCSPLPADVYRCFPE